MKHSIQPIGSDLNTVGKLRDSLTNLKDDCPLSGLRSLNNGRLVRIDKLALCVIESSGNAVIAGHGDMAVAFADGIDEADAPETVSFKNSSGEATTRSDEQSGDPPASAQPPA